MLPLNLSDTASTSQDGSSLEFIAPIATATTTTREFICDGVRQLRDNGQTISHNTMGLSVFLFLFVFI